jgi:hypothetical protein
VAPSLSFVVTAHNAHTRLNARVVELLEFLPELTPDFELLIMDDGSTDGTEEVAYELAREYPQIRVVRHGERRGPVAAMRTGMEQAEGRVVLVQDICESTPTVQWRRTWRQNRPAAGRSVRTDTQAQPLSDDSGELPNRAAACGDVSTSIFEQAQRRSRLSRASERQTVVAPVTRTDRTSTQPAPNFLARVRKFAFGE